MGKSRCVWNNLNTRIVIDSSSNVPESLQAQYRMIEVPTVVNFGTDSFRTNIDLTSDAFYERLVADEQLPTTSQPPPKFFADAYRQAFDEGAKQIIVVTISQKLSGTFASAQTAAREFDAAKSDRQGTESPAVDEDRFLFWDGDSISMGSGYQAIAAARLLEEGIERGELVEPSRSDPPVNDWLCRFGDAPLRGTQRSDQQPAGQYRQFVTGQDCPGHSTRPDRTDG